MMCYKFSQENNHAWVNLFENLIDYYEFKNTYIKRSTRGPPLSIFN